LLLLRYYLQNAVEAQASEVELFLNSVPILNPLSQEEKLQLVDAFEEKTYKPGEKVCLGCSAVPHMRQGSLPAFA